VKKGYQARARSDHGYSVVELLGVLLILGLLMALVLPALRLVQRSTETRRARAEATALAQAIMHYRQEYGHWPLADDAQVPDSTEESTTSSLHASQDFPGWLSQGVRDSLSHALGTRAYIPQSDLIAMLTTNRIHNPRSTLFLELQEDSIDTSGRLVDPWRQPYVVIMDPPSALGPWRIGNESVVAFSFGPPATGWKGITNLIFSAGVTP
jgi:type II secretory pathway pseudopilin PulG